MKACASTAAQPSSSTSSLKCQSCCRQRLLLKGLEGEEWALEGCEVLDFFKISIDSAEDACTTLGGAISGMGHS